MKQISMCGSIVNRKTIIALGCPEDLLVKFELLDFELVYGSEGRLSNFHPTGSAPWYPHDNLTEEGEIIGENRWVVSFETPEKAFEFCVTHRGKQRCP